MKGQEIYVRELEALIAEQEAYLKRLKVRKVEMLKLMAKEPRK